MERIDSKRLSSPPPNHQVVIVIAHRHSSLHHSLHINRHCTCHHGHPWLEWLENTTFSTFCLFRIILSQIRRFECFPIDNQDSNYHGRSLTDINFVAHFFVHPVTLNNFWKLQSDQFMGVARTHVCTFSEVGSLNLAWCPDLRWPESKIK